MVALVTDRDGPTISTGSTIYNSSTGIVTGTFELVDISGVASCRVTIFNSNNVDVASTTSCSRVSGTSTNGTWQVQIDMQNSAFNPGAYTMKVSATDTFGNTRAAQNIGAGFTKPGPSVSNLGSLPIPRTIGINYLDQIVLNSFDFSNIGAAPGSFTWTVRTTSASGVLASSIPIGSNQTYITGLSPSTTYNVVLVATDSAGGTKVSLPLTITTLAPAVAAPSISLFNATQSVNANSAISTVNVSNSGGASTNFSISPSLPSGLTFNSSNGSISGTPTQAQSQATYTITATNSGGSSSATFTLTVVMATISSPVVVLNSGILTSGVSASGSVTAGQYFGISWRVTSNDAIYTQVSLIDSSGNSASTGTGALVSGTTQDGTYQASLLVPQVFSSGRYLICVYAVNSKDMRSASQCGGRIQHVQVAEVQVNGVLVISTVALNGVVIGQGRGGVWAIKTFDRSNNYVQGAVAKANNGAPDINAARIIKSAGNNDARYPDNWQATFEVNNSAPNGTVYTIHWTLRQGDGTTIVGIGGEFRVG